MEEQYGIQGAYVILSISFGIYLTMRPLTTYLLRRRLLELGQWSHEAHRQMKEENQSPRESLKWGLILFFTGIGFIVVHFLDVTFDSSLAYGVIMVSAAIGFLLYYLLVSSRPNAN
ncbi:hypothetical protein IC229_06475 [Spirosoma sp. BT702]|uniref:DUF6249 domain-containing protein n=1 Tax=Spirosoma profusum TaxID=2771354 RepID=A0A926XUZ1_9BACT|nr:DUF6249 domain-containing protein [Spirosoma profusum]MBD2700270.1 hypothetical protein [Spirosoma profusum]